MEKPQLILDIGGVLLTNLSPFWVELASHANIPYEQMRSRYKLQMSEALWAGRVTENEFWTWLGREYATIDLDYAINRLQANLKPLPAFDLLPMWSEYADIHVLSNHRVEWITPALQPVIKHVKSLTISSEAGHFKPHPPIYEHAKRQLNGSRSVLFVDDQSKNLQYAAQLGWDTLLADEAGLWIDTVSLQLKNPRIDG